MNCFNVLLAFLFVLCIYTGTAQEVHRIKILIDTKNTSPEKAIQWSAGENTKVLDSGERDTYTIFAQVGDHIHWKAISLTEPEIPVRITRLKYISGPRIFSRDLIPVGEDTQATVIRGGSEYYSYEIQFKIGKDPKLYSTSSKIKIAN